MVLGAGALGREFGLDEVMNVHLYDEIGVLIKERKRLCLSFCHERNGAVHQEEGPHQK